MFEKNETNVRQLLENKEKVDIEADKERTFIAHVCEIEHRLLKYAEMADHEGENKSLVDALMVSIQIQIDEADDILRLIKMKPKGRLTKAQMAVKVRDDLMGILGKGELSNEVKRIMDTIINPENGEVYSFNSRFTIKDLAEDLPSIVSFVPIPEVKQKMKDYFKYVWGQ